MSKLTNAKKLIVQGLRMKSGGGLVLLAMWSAL